MIGADAADNPSVGIFWVVQTGSGAVHLLTVGCSLEAAEPYGDFLTFPDGHLEVWEQWRRAKDSVASLRATVRSFEYEEWPRGRIVFGQLKRPFVLYTDRKLLSPETIARIQKRFAIPAEKTTPPQSRNLLDVRQRAGRYSQERPGRREAVGDAVEVVVGEALGECETYRLN